MAGTGQPGSRSAAMEDNLDPVDGALKESSSVSSQAHYIPHSKQLDIEPATSMDALSSMTGVDQRDLEHTSSMEEEDESSVKADQSLSHMSTYAGTETSDGRDGRIINDSLDTAPSAASST